MKKSIIAAGAASVALAAIPIMGAFATVDYVGTPMTDTLQMTISDACTLSRATTAHTVGSTAPSGAAWTTGSGTGDYTSLDGTTNGGANALHDTFAASVVAGVDYAGIATSSFAVTCNQASGFKVSVTTTPFYTTGATPTATSWVYNASGKAASGSSWSLSSSAKPSTAIASGSAVWDAAADATPGAATTGSFTITYDVYPASNQESGTFAADAVYVLADLN